MSFFIKIWGWLLYGVFLPAQTRHAWFHYGLFYAVNTFCTALSHDCVCKEKGGMESGSSSYNFFRSSEFSPHVNTGSKISLFQSFNSYVVAKCKFNVGVFRYLTSMFPWSWTILKGRILSTSNFLSSSSALVRSDVGRFWEWAWLAPPCIKFLIRFFTLSGRFFSSWTQDYVMFNFDLVA